MSAAKWQPIIGEETAQLMQYLKLSGEGTNAVQQEAKAVLEKCVSPLAKSESETGLVIGYIQSGKTMSFTAVTAMARDNGFRLIIIMSGITRSLYEQSSDRLERDLQLKSRADRKWQSFRNPKAKPDVTHRLAAALDWDDSLPGFEKQSVLITVMKNRTHLSNLAKLLESLDLRGIPTLVIDDEADQASLNNLVREGDESATYQRIVRIRRLLPHHTFLQYTATPQALLLINLIDVLSPSFVSLLTPGSAYVGGKAFFEQDFKLIRRIPQNEIPSKDEHLSDPPDTLLEALQHFFLGVAVGLLQGSQGQNRSMLVHPAKELMQHADYANWIRSIQQTWYAMLNEGERDPDRVDLLEEFQATYTDLCTTVAELPPFNDIVPYLRGAVWRTPVVEVNTGAGKTPQIEWHQNYAYILVGGEVLNRGYTVEGLTVTYMPRGKGVGNADTIQQRARWFGYKADYLGYCRVYLTDETLNAYVGYVNHEEDVRGQMRGLLAMGGSVRDWRRAFFLAPELRPTRHEVLDLDYSRGNFSNAWVDTKAPYESAEIVQVNREVVAKFLATLKLAPDKGHPDRTPNQRHLVAYDVSLADAYRELLTSFRITGSSDSQRFTGAFLQISSLLEAHPNAVCTVFQMSPGIERKRSLDETSEILNLFQGAHPDKTGEVYPGDRQLRSSVELTIQLHSLDLYRENYKVLVDKDVPALAVWIPKEMSVDWIVQERM